MNSRARCRDAAQQVALALSSQEGTQRHQATRKSGSNLFPALPTRHQQTILIILTLVQFTSSLLSANRAQTGLCSWADCCHPVPRNIPADRPLYAHVTIMLR